MDCGWSKQNQNTFWLLKKRNYINRFISSLEIDGHIVKGSSKISEAQSKYYQNLYSEKLNSNVSDYKWFHRTG